MTANGITLDLWTERGVPYEEVRRRIGERTEEELLDAANAFREVILYVGEAIAEAADTLRTTDDVLNKYEPLYRKSIAFAPANQRQALLEIHALIVELYVRTANQLFPIHGSN